MRKELCDERDFFFVEGFLGIGKFSIAGFAEEARRMPALLRRREGAGIKAGAV